MSFAARCLLVFGIGLGQPLLAAHEDNSVLALEPLRGMAVVKNAAGKLEVIRTGDRFPGSEAVVRQVLADKLVAEEVVGEDPKVRQQVWIFRAQDADTGSRVERRLLDQPQNGAGSRGSTALRARDAAPDLLGANQ